MCRLYSQISLKPRTAADFLIDGERSLLRQSNYRRRDFQQDGWGIAYFNGAGPRLTKSSGAAFKEAGRFKAAARKARSKIVIGHLRAASNPMGSSKKELMRPENAQPFTDGRFIFAHNGTIRIPREVLKFLGPYKKCLRGSNDSEIYFWQFRKFFDLYGNVPDALEACVNELWTLWGYVKKKRGGKKKAPYVGLNTLVSDGDTLYALCHFPENHPKKSLFNPKQQWGRMTFARRGDRVILASEELDKDKWGHFGSSEIISAAIKGGKISLTRRPLRPSAR
jgi:glutamine amidotransferase